MSDCWRCEHLTSMADGYRTSRDQHMKAAAKLAVQLADAQATLAHAVTESDATAQALVLAHERRDEAAAEVEVLREENAELRCRVDELEAGE